MAVLLANSIELRHRNGGRCSLIGTPPLVYLLSIRNKSVSADCEVLRPGSCLAFANDMREMAGNGTSSATERAMSVRHMSCQPLK